MKFHQLFITSLLAVTSVVLSGCSNAQSSDSTIESFYRAVEAGDLAEAKDYIAPQVLAMVPDEKLSKGFTSNTDKIKQCGGIAKIESDLKDEGEVSSGTATITYKGQCPPKTEKGKLIKVDGKWKVTASK